MRQDDRPWPRSLDEAFSTLDVSRETAERWAGYTALLSKWNPTINLVSARSLPMAWQRHILDSAQLERLMPAEGTVVDLGSGGGLPGLVLSCFQRWQVHLIESDRRKAIFLGQVVRELDLKASVHALRIESAPPLEADVVTARALAPVGALLDLGQRFCGKSTQYLFLKSQDVGLELTEATKGWRFDADLTPSLSDPRGVILRMCNVERR